MIKPYGSDVILRESLSEMRSMSDMRVKPMKHNQNSSGIFPGRISIGDQVQSVTILGNLKRKEVSLRKLMIALRISTGLFVLLSLVDSFSALFWSEVEICGVVL